MKRKRVFDSEEVQLRRPWGWLELGILWTSIMVVPLVTPAVGLALCVMFVGYIWSRGSEVCRVTIGHHRVQVEDRLPFHWRLKADLAFDEIATVQVSGRALLVELTNGRRVRLLRHMEVRELDRIARELNAHVARRAVTKEQAEDADRRRRALEALTRASQ